MKYIGIGIVIFCSLFLFTPFVFAANISLSGGKLSIISTDEYTVSVVLSVFNAAITNYYLRGVFYKPNTTRYCGYTWNGSSWFKGPYSSNNGWTNFLQITTHNSSWSGQLKAKIDTTQGECADSGTYNFKIERFTKDGTGTFDTQTVQSVQVSAANQISFAPTQSTLLITSTSNPTTTPDSTPIGMAASESPTSTPDFPQSNSSTQTDSSVSPTPVTVSPHETIIPAEDTPTPMQAGSIEDTLASQTPVSVQPTASSAVLGLQVEPTSSGLSNDPRGVPAKGGVSSGTWYVLFMLGVLLMAGCGIVLFQIRRRVKHKE